MSIFRLNGGLLHLSTANYRFDPVLSGPSFSQSEMLSGYYSSSLNIVYVS